MTRLPLSRQSRTDLAFSGSGQLLGDRTAYSTEAFYSNAAHGSSERAVPPSPHALSHPLSLADARRVVRQPNRTDDELLAACKVLRLKGNYDDEWIVTQIEQAVAQFQNMIEVTHERSGNDNSQLGLGPDGRSSRVGDACMIHACIPFGATVIFRANPAQHYQTGRVFGVCKKGPQEFYDIEDINGGRHFGLEDVKEETNVTSD